MTDQTARLALPLLAAGQAQKELFHNEALAALDVLVQPVAQTCGDNAPPAAPSEGGCWIIGATPTGDWSGHPQALASWTNGGWRFAGPFEGMVAWIASAGLPARYAGGLWQLGIVAAASIEIGGNPVIGARQAAIGAPAGGSIADAEARAAIDAILAALRNHGLIAS